MQSYVSKTDLGWKPGPQTQASGKTCAILSHVRSSPVSPSLEYVPTVYNAFDYVYRTGRRAVAVQVRDTGGLCEYNRLRLLSYGSEVDVVLITYSVLSRPSLSRVADRWAGEIRESCPKSVVLLVGCKSDFYDQDSVVADMKLKGAPIVSMEEGQSMARRLGFLGHMQCSAVTQKGITDVFEAAARAGLAVKTRFFTRRWRSGWWRFWPARTSKSASKNASQVRTAAQRPRSKAPWWWKLFCVSDTNKRVKPATPRIHDFSDFKTRYSMDSIAATTVTRRRSTTTTTSSSGRASILSPPSKPTLPRSPLPKGTKSCILLSPPSLDALPSSDSRHPASPFTPAQNCGASASESLQLLHG